MRILTGFGIGATVPVMFTMVFEITPGPLRGPMGVRNNLLTLINNILTHLNNILTPKTTLYTPLTPLITLNNLFTQVFFFVGFALGEIMVALEYMGLKAAGVKDSWRYVEE